VFVAFLFMVYVDLFVPAFGYLRKRTELIAEK
jgi:hypothetical protein